VWDTVKNGASDAWSTVEHAAGTYKGSISKCQKKGGVVAYDVRILHKDFYPSKRLNTEAEVEQYICNTNVRVGLPIKNRFIIFEDWVEVELAGGKALICNIDDLFFIESHTWCSTPTGYVSTCTSGITTQQFFHNVVMKHIPNAVTINHINRNGLDNRQANLRLVNKKTQNIN